MIGDKLSPILEEIEDTLLVFAVDYPHKTCYTFEGFRAAAYIFMSAMMDKMYDYQDTKNMTLTERENQATEVGTKIRELILDYTGIDSFQFYETK
jgi:hypothetical protein